MSRLVVLTILIAACTKSAGNQDKVATPPPSGSSGGDMIAVPGGGPTMGGPGTDRGVHSTKGGTDDERFRLKPEEGNLVIESPTGAKAGAEAIAKIVVTPAIGYHVNTDYPTKLTLTSPQGVTLAKAELTAGGHSAKGDADALDEKRLAFAIKLTPAASGNYTINGSFKFAVCDKDQCLPKRESIAIAVVAAK